MGEYKALKLFVYLIIYFFAFGTILTILSLDDTNIENEVDLNFSDDSFCDGPRIAYNIHLEAYEVFPTSNNCKHTRVAYDKNGCEDLYGCSFINDTGWFSSDEYVCNGTINFSRYGESLGSDIDNLCRFEGVQVEDVCYDVGCTWYNDAEEYSDIKSPNTLLSVTGSLFSLRYDFGLTGIFNIITNFIMFYIPLILLVGSIYFMLPILH